MRKLGYVIAAISAIALAAPSIANAETVVVKRDHVHRDYLHRDWHRAWHRDHGWRHHDKTVIIKNRRYEG
jgi:Ni/Co efflux regulator RcnB